MKILKSKVFLVICLIVLLPVVYLIAIKLEGNKPVITIEKPTPYIGKTQSLSITVSDAQSGIRKIWVGLVKDGKETTLLKKDLPSAGIISGGMEHKTSFNISIEPKNMGIADGKALLRMVAVDYSWRNWLRGNTAYLEKEVIIDTKPPSVDVLSRIHNVSQGGSGVVIYKLSEPCDKSGVVVGENFFPGYSGYFKDKNVFMAFFALNYKQGPGTRIFVEATDLAGNSAKAGFPYYIKKSSYRNVSLHISDRFLNWKMPQFNVDISPDSKTPLVDKFLKVNREVRVSNANKLIEIISNSTGKLYWKNSFLRFPNSAREASFADHRKYIYKHHVIDKEVHLGMDLASVAHSPIPAANDGKVVYVGNLGIYGNTVVIDHGFGLFSTYSHLSRFDVKEGQMVSRGQIIGHTGSTGLAGGDHLHFGMMVHNTFVNPVEWWDAAWIKNNITSKIKRVKALIK